MTAPVTINTFQGRVLPDRPNEVRFSQNSRASLSACGSVEPKNTALSVSLFGPAGVVSQDAIVAGGQWEVDFGVNKPGAYHMLATGETSAAKVLITIDLVRIKISQEELQKLITGSTSVPVTAEGEVPPGASSVTVNFSGSTVDLTKDATIGSDPLGNPTWKVDFGLEPAGSYVLKATSGDSTATIGILVPPDPVSGPGGTTGGGGTPPNPV